MNQIHAVCLSGPPLPLSFQWGAPRTHPPAPGTHRNRSGSKNDVDRPKGWAEIFILEPKSAKQHLGHDLAEIGRRGEGGFEPATARNREPRPRPLGHGGSFPLGNRPPGESPPRGITPWGIIPQGNHPPGESPPGESPLGNHPPGESNHPPRESLPWDPLETQGEGGSGGRHG